MTQATKQKKTAKSQPRRSAKAVLKGYLHSPQKTRLTVDTIRGKGAGDARLLLSHTPKRAAATLAKVLDSAIANAHDKGLAEENLLIKEIRVDGGRILYRSMPRARGRATPKRRRTSHITIVLQEQ